MFKKLSVLMLLAVAMVTKPEEFKGLEKCLSQDKDYYNSDEMAYRRKHKCGCEQFCCINTATLTVSGLANFNGSSVNVRNQLTLNGVNLNSLLGISGAAGINGETAAVGLVDQNGAQTNSGGAYGLGLTTFGNWYAQVPTDSAGPIAAGSPIPFLHAGPVSATGITHPSSTTFVLPAIGTYEVTYFASFAAIAGGVQLSINVDGVPQPQSVIGNSAAVTTPSQVFGTALITTTVVNSVVQVINSSTNALTLSSSAGTGAASASAGITIKRIA